MSQVHHSINDDLSSESNPKDLTILRHECTWRSLVRMCRKMIPSKVPASLILASVNASSSVQHMPAGSVGVTTCWQSLGQPPYLTNSPIYFASLRWLPLRRGFHRLALWRSLKVPRNTRNCRVPFCRAPFLLSWSCLQNPPWLWYILMSSFRLYQLCSQQCLLYPSTVRH